MTFQVSPRQDDWTTSPTLPASIRLSPDDVHVVRFELDAIERVDELWTLLDAGERARAQRFVHASDRRRFISAHGLMRIALGRCIDRHPAQLGVDIELERPTDVLELARRFFSPAEYRALSALPVGAQQRAFFRGWTRKESFVKALGDGLSFPLDGFDVSFDEQAEATPDASVLLGCGAAPHECGRWRISPLVVDEGYAAAITVAGDGWRLYRWRSPGTAGPADLAW
jgi:4'-phosphopantetheinyl transferase